MKIGDLVRYEFNGDIGVVLYVNDVGGTLKVMTTDGRVTWIVTSYCVIME